MYNTRKLLGLRQIITVPTKIIIVQQWSVEKKSPVHKNMTIRLSESKLLDFESKLDMHRIALQVEHHQAESLNTFIKNRQFKKF
jgi:hypothetical protein